MDGTVLKENKEKLMKKMKFDKKEDWCLYTFYQIYEKNEIKIIRLIGSTDRKSNNKNYLSWIITYYGDDCEMILKDFLLWDVYYQKEMMISDSTELEEKETSPEECFIQSNEWLKGNGNGSYFLKFLNITEDTPCGYYYGF